MRRCTMMAHLRLMTLSLMVMPACRRASRRPSNAARSCARRGPARNVLFCLQTLKNGILTHPSFWEDYCFFMVGEILRHSVIQFDGVGIAFLIRQERLKQGQLPRLCSL